MMRSAISCAFLFLLFAYVNAQQQTCAADNAACVLSSDCCNSCCVKAVCVAPGSCYSSCNATMMSTRAGSDTCEVVKDLSKTCSVLVKSADTVSPILLHCFLSVSDFIKLLQSNPMLGFSKLGNVVDECRNAFVTAGASAALMNDLSKLGADTLSHFVKIITQILK